METHIVTAVADFYQAEYDYEKFIVTFDKDTDKRSEVISEGLVLQDPYKEHIKVVSSKNEALWKEIYYEKSEISGKVDAYIATKDGWVLQRVTRNRPHGYGEDLHFKFDREDTIDGKDVEIYTAEYTKNISEAYQIQDDLTYTVKQEYYLDKDRNILIRVVTDLSDMSEKIAIANDMSANRSTIEEAENNFEQINGLQQKEILNIYNYGNPTEIKWPEIN